MTSKIQRLVSCALLGAFAGPASAQETEATTAPAQASEAALPAAPCEPCARKRRGVEGAGGFMLGAAFIDLSDLNDHLSAAGFEEVDSAMVLLGGQAHAVFESGFVVGGHGGAFLTPSADGPGEVRASVGGGFGMADFGFAFVHTPSSLLTLTGGIGGYGLGVDLSEHRTLAFDDVLDDPRRSASLSAGGLLVGITLGFDGRIPIGDVDEEGMRPFFGVGARAGALFGPPLGEWTLGDGTETTGGPSTTFASAYAALLLSFGGMPARR
jgi:hypothetical protein